MKEGIKNDIRETVPLYDEEVEIVEDVPCSTCGLLTNCFEVYATLMIGDEEVEEKREHQFCSRKCWLEFID